MKSYTEREFLHRHRWTLDAMFEVIEAVPHLDKLGREVRCHELARVATHVLLHDRRRFDYDRHIMQGNGKFPVIGRTDFRYVDGHYGPADHSWVVVDDGKPYHDDAILDVYAVGSLPPVQLLYGGFIFRAQRLAFKPGEERGDIREDVIDDLLWLLWKKRYERKRGDNL